MAVSETLNFENARTLSHLYAGDPKNLQDVEKAFNVQTTSRDAWLKVEGTQEAVTATKDLFARLESAYKKGVQIRRHEFVYAIDAVKSGKASELEQLWDHRIQISARKPGITPKTFGQKAYLDSIRNYDLVFGLGPAGTGKTFLAMAVALESMKADQVRRIILTRPAVEAGEALGFLPGDLQEKLFPYLRPLYDALYEMMDGEEVQKCLDKGIIEIAPLAYMRGRTLSNAFVILDEGQNATTEQMFMFLTRLGQGSKCVVTGDPTQVDLPHNRKSGLIEATQALSEVKGVKFMRLEEKEIVRHELVAQIVSAYKSHRGARQTSMTL